MSHFRTDAEHIRSTHNTARYFVNNRHVAWILLIGTMLWGVYGYMKMPQRKDPDIPVRQAVAITMWPGAAAEKVEQLVTRKIEEKIAENSHVEKIESISRTGISMVYIDLDEKVADPAKQFDDIKMKLDELKTFPEGVLGIQFIKDFGDTAAMMLTVASPRAGGVEISLRADAVAGAIGKVRSGVPAEFGTGRVSGVVCVPFYNDLESFRRRNALIGEAFSLTGLVRDVRRIEGPGFVGLDMQTDLSDRDILALLQMILNDKLHVSEFHPDAWDVALIRDIKETGAKLTAAAGGKYSFRELEDFSTKIKKALHGIPLVTKITRTGILEERVYLEFSQERLAAYKVQPFSLEDALKSSNVMLPGGVTEVAGKLVAVEPSADFKIEKEIGDVPVIASAKGAPVYLRDLVSIERGYESPPGFLNLFVHKEKNGTYSRLKAITIAVQMRSGEHIEKFGRAVDTALEEVKTRLPEDLIVVKTSDQPEQVRESVDLFMKSLWEAIALVVLISWIGFWEWRSAVLMALSIPVTLAMTFGMMHLAGIDLQQVSIAALIIALGLLVDDPVVAGDAIRHELDGGHPKATAAWLGPTKLASAIFYATITNIVAYLPFLMVSGDSGRFIFTLPIVLTCSLVASRIVSMTFIPLLGLYILEPSKAGPSGGAKPSGGFTGLYRDVCAFVLDHRWKAFAASLVFLFAGFILLAKVPSQFFPKDLSNIFYVDVWLPEDANLYATDDVVQKAEKVIQHTLAEYGQAYPAGDGKPREILDFITVFMGGGGPRFWYSVNPEMNQLNYAQLVIQVKDKHDTRNLIWPLQKALTENVAGARFDVMQLESGKPIGTPIQIRVSGSEEITLRNIGEKIKQMYTAVGDTDRQRDDWGAQSFSVEMDIDRDRAVLAGVSNRDIAMSTVASLSGHQVASLRENDKLIPIIVRMRMEDRANLSDLGSLYVYSSGEGNQRVTLKQVANLNYRMRTEKMRSRNQQRTLTVACAPLPGIMPSQIVEKLTPKLDELKKELPPGCKIAIGGEQEEQDKGFAELTVVMLISIACIFLALVVQFKNAVKPLIVFAAVPYGMAGSFAALAIMNAPFGFMAFLGVVSLIGVIVSHVIVKFEYVEELREKGVPLREALVEAGAGRLRPVMITVGATIFGLVPLAMHGGPLWEPLCYAQIGGLAFATFITLLLVPVLYSIFVLDLKLVKWEKSNTPPLDNL